MQKFLCPRCGYPLVGNEKFCPNCGYTFTALQQDSTAFEQKNTGPAVQTDHLKHSGLGIASFVLSFIPFLNIIGLILGIIDICSNKNRKHGLSIAAIVIGICMCIPIVLFFIHSSSANTLPAGPDISLVPEQSADESQSIPESDESSIISEHISSEVPQSSSVPDEPIKVGEAVYYDEYSAISLVCVRKLDHISLSNGQTLKVGKDKEIIYLIFDFGNFSKNTMNLTKVIDGSFFAYANEEFLTEPKASVPVAIDGYQAYDSYRIDSDKNAFIVKAYEVDKGWDAIYVGLLSGVWEILPEDISQEPFRGESIFWLPNHASTGKDKLLYFKEYKIRYNGFDMYEAENSDRESKYAIFKFTIENSSSEVIDYTSSAAFIRGYQDDHLLDRPSHAITKPIDGFINIYDCGPIGPGETAEVYIAFHINKEDSVFSCVFNIGKVEDEILCIVEVR